MIGPLRTIICVLLKAYRSENVKHNLKILTSAIIQLNKVISDYNQKCSTNTSADVTVAQGYP